MRARSSLTLAGYGWSLLSLLAALCICAGYYMPSWLVNGVLKLHDNWTHVQFGPFRRCGYTTPPTHDFLTDQCGRYDNFSDIPSMWWKLTTVMVGIAAGISLLVGFITVPACCLDSVLTRSSARLLGVLQYIGGLLTCIGSFIFPLGWENVEVRLACGNAAAPYMLGTCKIGWCYYAVLAGALGLMVSGSLSCVAAYPLWEYPPLPKATTLNKRRNAPSPANGFLDVRDCHTANSVKRSFGSNTVDV